jgi:aldehyde dehydrogenase (NAD+)
VAVVDRSAAQRLIDRVASPGFLIGDGRQPTGSAGSYEHRDPTTGLVQAAVPLAGAAEVDAAVSAATDATASWRALRADRRAAVLFRLADLLEANADESAVLQAVETGAPVSGMKPGRYTAGWVRYYAGWVDKLEGSVIPTYPRRGLDYVVPEPYGVVGIVPPWNGSMMGMGQKVAPALAAGNTVVAKPPELAPFGAYRFAELALEAGLPPGVLNVVAGGAEAGEALVRHSGIAKVSFTGGTDTATAVMRAASETLTPLTLELGGKSANIVFADADLERASMLASMAFAVLAGQGCALPTRLLVQDSVHDEVVERLLALVTVIPVGDPLDPGTVVGPVITRSSQQRVLDLITTATDDGATLAAGGHAVGGELAEGFFVEPTILDGVAPDAAIAQQEVFGPVLSVLRFTDEDEAVAIANGTRYGLAAYLHTTDLARAHRVAADLRAGSVGINDAPTMCPSVPFGGVGMSGTGREGGAAGLAEFYLPKNVFVGF